jgi:serine/threonine protein kinase
VKPSNVLVDGDGRVKLADFGVARVTTGGGRGITKRGSRRGTPAYMAAEQARDPASAGPPADVYGLGATLYHAVSGAPPYGEGTPIGVILEKLDKGESPAPFAGSITSASIGLTDAIVVSMSKDPEKRFPDGRALRTALLTVLDLSARVRFPR